MPIDNIFLSFLVKELKQIENQHIDKIHCPSGGEFVFVLRRKKLFVNLNGTPYITLLNESFLNPENPPMFCMLLRKYLGGGKILKVEKNETDRIVVLTISSLNEMGDVSVYELIIELISAKANLILTKDGKIIDCYKKSDLEKDSRIIAPGASYCLPSGNSSGLSPLIARELEHQNVNIEALINNAKPTALINEQGEYKDLSFTEIKQYEGYYKTVNFESFVELVNTFFTEKRKNNLLKNAAVGLEKRVNNLLNKAERKLSLRKTDLLKTEERETVRIYGELIKANLYKISAGQTKVTVENYYDEMKPITIPLKENLSPNKNAERYFKEYKKLCNARNTLVTLIEENKVEIEYLMSVKEFLNGAKTVEDVLEIEEELCIAGLYKRQNNKRQRKIKEKPFLEKEFGGFKILIGKNNLENDRLTLKTAEKTDMWFHTKNIPGSHVVVETCGKELPSEVILYAAKLAAENSSGKNSSQVAVDYTLIKNIKKPNGAKPGMVIYKTNQTVYVTPNKE